MTPFLYLLIVLILLSSGYWVALRFFRGRSFWRYAQAKVTQIELQKIGSLWSLHLLVSYDYLVKGKLYRGKGEWRIEEFMGEQPFLLREHNGMPHLLTQEISLMSEEYIETYLMDLHPEVIISVFSFWPKFNKIPQRRLDKKSLFQDISIDFPWT